MEILAKAHMVASDPGSILDLDEMLSHRELKLKLKPAS